MLPERYRLKEPYYLSFQSGARGVTWGYQRQKRGTRVNLHFWVPQDHNATLQLYQRVADHRAEIEAALGEALAWQVNRAGANIALEIGDEPRSEAECDLASFDAMLDGMRRFRRVLEPWL